MRRRLFEDLVLSGRPTGERGPWRGLRFSLALHGAVVAGLAALSMSAVSEPEVRAAPVVLPPLERPSGGRSATIRKPPTGRVNAGHKPVVVADPPPAVPILSDVPAPDADILTADDTPAGDGTLCLSGCVPGAEIGGGENGTGTGPVGAGDGGAPVRPGGDIREPRRIAGPLPVYPEAARRAHIEGKVVIECVIDVDGRVTDLKVVSGHPLFNEAALDAVRRWVYTPTTLNKQPVRVIMTVTVKFGLERN